MQPETSGSMWNGWEGQPLAGDQKTDCPDDTFGCGSKFKKEGQTAGVGPCVFTYQGNPFLNFGFSSHSHVIPSLFLACCLCFSVVWFCSFLLGVCKKKGQLFATIPRVEMNTSVFLAKNGWTASGLRFFYPNSSACQEVMDGLCEGLWLNKVVPKWHLGKWSQQLKPA